jgi:DDE superfamily endonuclease
VVLGDLWCSSKHRHHGGNIQVLPTRYARVDSTIPPRCAPTRRRCRCWRSGSDEGHAVLGDLGYEGEADLLRIPIKRIDGAALTDDQRILSRLHAVTRALAERGPSLLKITFTALRRVGPCPWRIGAITAVGRRPVGIGREPRRCPFHPAPVRASRLA